MSPIRLSVDNRYHWPSWPSGETDPSSGIYELNNFLEACEQKKDEWLQRLAVLPRYHNRKLQFEKLVDF
jgi:hypothetical protein